MQRAKATTIKRVSKPRLVSVPRSEKEVMKKIDDWCTKQHPYVKVQKSEYSKLIESTGEKKVIDATIIGKYSKRARAGEHGCIISELEFEEHKANYSILKDMTMITIPLRKLDYWRNDIAQFWIKVDKDGTPFMLNFRHIKANENNLDKMNPTGRWQKNNQITRIITAQRKSKEDKWPEYVIVGWGDIFCELDRVIKLAKF